MTTLNCNDWNDLFFHSFILSFDDVLTFKMNLKNPIIHFLTGGIILTVTGYGFKLDAALTVGGASCPVVTATHTQITCTVPASVSIYSQ